MSFRPEVDNLVSLLANTLKLHGARPSFGTRNADKSWSFITWNEFGAKVDAFRAVLVGLGVGRGDRVAIIANNRLAWVVGAFASYGLGACYVPMYEAMLDKDWKYILEDSGAKLCLVANDAIARRVASLLPDLALVNLDRDFERLLAEGQQKPVPALTPAGNDVACLIYTSGTTGNPKGVQLTQLNFAATAQAIRPVFSLEPDDRLLAFLPWAHVAGAGSELNTIIISGASAAICEKTDWILESLAEVRPTVLLAVPRIWNAIYAAVRKQMASQPKVIQMIFHAALRAHEKRKRGEQVSRIERLAGRLARRLIFRKIVDRFGGRLKYALSGAAALSPDVAMFIDAVGIEVYEAYGLTETTGAVIINPKGASRIGSVGKPIPGITVRLDADGAPSQAQGEGQVILYGHGIMAGYHNRPEETRQALTQDGGLRTGDLGRLDADGYLYITGRVKELYKLENGKYVSPAPLEEKITLSPFIKQCMVYGQDKPFNVAVLVPDVPSLEAWARAHGGAALGGATLLAHPDVRALFAAELEKYAPDKGFERIMAFTLVPEEFSVENDMLTPSLKVKRRVVVARHGDAIEALYPKR